MLTLKNRISPYLDYTAEHAIAAVSEPVIKRHHQIAATSLYVDIRGMQRSTDLKAVTAIEQAADWHNPPNEADILKELKPHDVVALVAEYRGVIVGWVLYRPILQQTEIIRLVVREDFRRRSIGTQLLHAVEQRTRKAKRTHLMCASCDKDLDFHLLLRKEGFKAADVLRGYTLSGSDAYLFEKVL